MGQVTGAEHSKNPSIARPLGTSGAEGVVNALVTNDRRIGHRGGINGVRVDRRGFLSGRGRWFGTTKEGGGENERIDAGPKTPNSKLQTPKKLQIPRSKGRRFSVGHATRHWVVGDIWRGSARFRGGNLHRFGCR